MDVTSDTVTAETLVSGTTATKNDGTKITGTNKGPTYTATISGSGSSGSCYITYKGVKYYTNGDIFTFNEGDTFTFYGKGHDDTGSVYINGEFIKTGHPLTYTYTLPIGDINIELLPGNTDTIYIYTYVKPTGSLSISAAGTHNVYQYSQATVSAGSAFPPAMTITKAPTFSMNSATGVVTASYTGSSSITPTITSGYITAGTAGTISTTGTSTYQLTSKAAATYYPSTADQTISSYRWLTGAQTIKSITTSNLTAANIAEGVVVKVGDSTNASRITQVTGTHSGGEIGQYRAYITGTVSDNSSIEYNGKSYNTINTGFNFNAREIITVYARDSQDEDMNIYVNGTYVASGSYSFIPNAHFEISWTSLRMDIVVAVAGGFTADQIATYAISGNISGDATTIKGYAFYNCSYLTAASFPTCSSIGSYAFYAATQLTTVSFPSCKTIGSHAFEYCGSLISVTFPMCSIINSCAFSYCEGLTTVSFPSCKSIGYSAFYYCSVLSTISFPSCTTISDGAFMYCRSLTSVNFPSCTNVGLSAFYGCYNLSIISFPVCKNIQGNAFPGTKITEANFPNVSSIAYYAFSGCSSLITANFPSCTTIQSNAFAGCSVLSTISFPLCASISSYAFQSCYNLLSVYLLGSSVPKLANANAFYSTPISDYTTSTGGVYGSIFVPSSLYNSYLTATNWSLYSDRIVSV